jgi:hypothetical protein
LYALVLIFALFNIERRRTACMAFWTDVVWGVRWRLVFAAIAVVAIVLSLRFCRSAHNEPAETSSTARPTAPVRDPDATTSVRARVRPSLAMPAPAVAPVVVRDECATGTNAQPGWWECLPRSPAWDAERARYLIDRLARTSDVHIAPDKIECRTRCCRVFVPRDAQRAHELELQSPIGLRIGPTDGYISGPVRIEDPASEEMITTCWRPGAIEDYPDRAVERDQLLTDAAADLAACARGLDAAVERPMIVEVNEDGSVESVEPVMHGNYDATTECIRAALRRAAAFAPSPDMMGLVPVRVHLPP